MTHSRPPVLWQHPGTSVGDRAGSGREASRSVLSARHATSFELPSRRVLPPALLLVSNQDLVVQMVDLDRDLLHVYGKLEEGGHDQPVEEAKALRKAVGYLKGFV